MKITGDEFEIRIVWDGETVLMTGVMAVVGGLLGYYTGGRLSTTLGTVIGGATGFATAKIISHREAWAKLKEKLKDVLYLIFNYLRRLDARDYLKAFDTLMSCASNRRELVLKIVKFIAEQLQKEVLCNISTHYRRHVLLFCF